MKTLLLLLSLSLILLTVTTGCDDEHRDNMIKGNIEFHEDNEVVSVVLYPFNGSTTIANAIEIVQVDKNGYYQFTKSPVGESLVIFVFEGTTQPQYSTFGGTYSFAFSEEGTYLTLDWNVSGDGWSNEAAEWDFE